MRYAIVAPCIVFGVETTSLGTDDIDGFTRLLDDVPYFHHTLPYLQTHLIDTLLSGCKNWSYHVYENLVSWVVGEDVSILDWADYIITLEDGEWKRRDRRGWSEYAIRSADRALNQHD